MQIVLQALAKKTKKGHAFIVEKFLKKYLFIFIYTKY